MYEVLGRPTQFKKIKDDPVLGGCVGEMPTRDSFGIDWPTQFRNIKADTVLVLVVGEMPTAAADEKRTETPCSPSSSPTVAEMAMVTTGG